MALAVLAVTLTGSAARADEDEASFHVQAVGGIARIKDSAADTARSGQVSTAPLVGVEGRVSYAISDWYQFDASLTLAGTGTAHFDLGTFMPPGLPPQSGAFGVAQQLARLDAGITARLGVRFIPTVRLALGGEARRVGSPAGFGSSVRAATLGADLVVVASVGFDYRVDRHLIAGVAVGGSDALPLGGDGFQTLEATAHVAWYWYPR